MREYKNGPLPDCLMQSAFVTPDESEFALPKEEALKYLGWCKNRALSVLGFDVWIPSQHWPTVIENLTFEGNIDESEKAIQAMDNTSLIFNIWIDTKWNTPE